MNCLEPECQFQGYDDTKKCWRHSIIDLIDKSVEGEFDVDSTSFTDTVQSVIRRIIKERV